MRGLTPWERGLLLASDGQWDPTDGVFRDESPEAFEGLEARGLLVWVAAPEDADCDQISLRTELGELALRLDAVASGVVA